MFGLDKQKTFLSQILTILKNNLKVVIFFILSIFLIIIFFQYYLYKKESKILELSKVYHEAQLDFNSNLFEEKMTMIAGENGFFGILASLELIKKIINNKNYNYAYNEYLRLLKKNDSNKIYDSVIALHGAYNLIDYISSDNILILLSFVDESTVFFNSHKDEINFLLSIKNHDYLKVEELSNSILNDKYVSETIKERVRKLNEFEKYQ